MATYAYQLLKHLLASIFTRQDKQTYTLFCLVQPCSNDEIGFQDDRVVLKNASRLISACSACSSRMLDSGLTILVIKIVVEIRKPTHSFIFELHSMKDVSPCFVIRVLCAYERMWSCCGRFSRLNEWWLSSDVNLRLFIATSLTGSYISSQGRQRSFQTTLYDESDTQVQEVNVLLNTKEIHLGALRIEDQRWSSEAMHACVWLGSDTRFTSVWCSK